MSYSRKLFLSVLVIIVAAFGYFSGRERGGAPVSLVAAVDNPLVLDVRTKTANCQVYEGLPDQECTPGGIFPEATKEKICVSGYTKTVRKVSVSLKKQVYREYGIPYPQPTGSFEADHFVPLALGGNNDISNLFPEAASPPPGFKEKDVVEVYLHNEVCRGAMSLSSAQRAIVTNWIDVYNSISSNEITRIKNQYRNWSN